MISNLTLCRKFPKMPFFNFQLCVKYFEGKKQAHQDSLLTDYAVASSWIFSLSVGGILRELLLGHGAFSSLSTAEPRPTSLRSPR